MRQPDNIDSSEEQRSLLALRLVPGLGARVAMRLIQQFGSAAGVFRASATELESMRVSSNVVRSIGTGTVFEEAEKEAERARQLGISIISFRDTAYPALLGEIFDPPLLLYARGDQSLMARPSVGIVGSRRPTQYGKAMAEKLAGELAAHGLVITSGLARGIDSASHVGCLRAGGKTIGVLGCGIDEVYPAENKKLFDEVIEKGLLLSEFPLGSFPAPQNFPIRNRIISGLSVGLVVVEAARDSGSLITAKLALEQNREVFAIPGSITNPNSWGPHLLIKQGAKLVQDWQDVVDDLPADVREGIVLPLLATASEGARSASNVTGNLSEIEKALFEQLKIDEAAHIDDLLAALPKLSASEILAGLLDLEFKGLVRQLPGKNFVKTV